MVEAVWQFKMQTVTETVKIIYREYRKTRISFVLRRRPKEQQFGVQSAEHNQAKLKGGYAVG